MNFKRLNALLSFVLAGVYLYVGSLFLGRDSIIVPGDGLLLFITCLALAVANIGVGMTSLDLWVGRVSDPPDS